MAARMRRRWQVGALLLTAALVAAACSPAKHVTSGPTPSGVRVSPGLGAGGASNTAPVLPAPPPPIPSASPVNLEASATVAVGAGPTGIAIDPGTHTVYVANTGAGTVSVIQGTTVTATIPVGNGPTGIAVDPSTHLVYVTNARANTVSVIQGTAVSSTIPVPGGPNAVAVDPATHAIYVTEPAMGNVLLVKGATSTPLYVGNRPVAVAFDTGTAQAVAALQADNDVVYLPVTGTQHSAMAGTGPNGVAVDPGNHNVYVTDAGANAVTLITSQGINPIALPSPPSGVAVDQATHLAVVVLSGSLEVVNGRALAGSAQLGGVLQQVAIDPSVHTAYVTDSSRNLVDVVAGVGL